MFQRPSYLVPELTGMPVAEARNLIAPNDWEIDVQSERSDEQPEVGHVIRTAPAAGVELAEGEPFLMVVSEGPLLRELPESTGKPLSEAQTALAGLRAGGRDRRAVRRGRAARHVISWSVPGDATLAAGSIVEPDTVVQLVISKGPAPRVVPNIIGLSVADATTQLTDLQLTLSQGEQVFSDDFPLGAVVSQSVPEGTEVPRGSDVSVVVFARSRHRRLPRHLCGDHLRAGGGDPRAGRLPAGAHVRRRAGRDPERDDRRPAAALPAEGPTAGALVSGRALATRGFWIPRRRPETVTLVHLTRA